MFLISVIAVLFGGFAVISVVETIGQALPLMALYLPGVIVLFMVLLSLHRNKSTDYRMKWSDPLMILAFTTNLIGSSAAIHFIGGA